MSGQSKKSGSMFVFLVIAFIAAIAISYVTNKTKVASTEATDAVPLAASSQEQSANVITATASEQSNGINVTSANEARSINIDIEILLKPRALGNINAPVKISEHSSFTCGHCAVFHGENFKKIKEEYIDTGKAYIVFNDFPRNQVDIEAGALARCIIGDDYFKFIQLLFATQSQWTNSNYKKFIKQNAMIAGGLSEDQAEFCINNKAVHEALATGRQNAMTLFKIDSTPHLVINDKIVVPGLLLYEDIKKVIEEALAKIKEPEKQ